MHGVGKQRRESCILCAAPSHLVDELRFDQSGPHPNRSYKLALIFHIIFDLQGDFSAFPFGHVEGSE